MADPMTISVLITTGGILVIELIKLIKKFQESECKSKCFSWKLTGYPMNDS